MSFYSIKNRGVGTTLRQENFPSGNNRYLLLDISKKTRNVHKNIDHVIYSEKKEIMKKKKMKNATSDNLNNRISRERSLRITMICFYVTC